MKYTQDFVVLLSCCYIPSSNRIHEIPILFRVDSLAARQLYDYLWSNSAEYESNWSVILPMGYCNYTKHDNICCFPIQWCINKHNLIKHKLFHWTSFMDKVVMISKTLTARGLFLESKVLLADIFTYICMNLLKKKSIYMWAIINHLYYMGVSPSHKLLA